MDSVRIKDRSIAAGIILMSVTILFFAYRSASDRRRVESLREQNRVLRQSLSGLERSFEDIRSYTRAADNLTADRLKQGEILLEADTEYVETKAHSLGLIAYLSSSVIESGALTGSNRERSDAEEFARAISQVDDMKSQTDMVVRRIKSLATILKYKKEFMRGIPSLKPTEGRVTSEFGTRLSPFDGARQMHSGLDISAKIGAPVKSSAEGVVTYVGKFESLGNTIVIKHSSGMLTRYGHLNKSLVRKGDEVKRGDVIAQVGNSGNSTGPHLHYEVWVKNRAVNPSDFFFDITDTSEMMSRVVSQESAPEY